jgi:hypothetical protein
MNKNEIFELKRTILDEKENTQKIAVEMFTALRGNAASYQIATGMTKRVIQGIDELPARQSLLDYVSERLASQAREMGMVRGVANFTINNELGVNFLVTSNLDNHKLLMPMTLRRELAFNMSLSRETSGDNSRLRRHVRMEHDYEEEVAYNASITSVGYHDYTSTADLAKALMLNKTELEYLPYDTRRRIQDRLAASRCMQSIFTRLVKGYLYMIGLKYNGGQNRVVTVDIGARDLLLTYTPHDIGLACSSDNISVIHADKSDDNTYLAFLKMIGSNFPVYREAFFVNYAGDNVMRIGDLVIGGEYENICIMCDREPAWTERGDRNFTFNYSLWNAMLVNYARSIGEEDSLDLAFACACTLAFHDKLPNVSLPAIRCSGEVFTRSKATTTMPGIVPVTRMTDDLLVGGFMAACTAALYYKEIMSHDISRRGIGNNSRTVVAEILGEKRNREPLYGNINHVTNNAAGDVLRRIDAFRIEDDSDICDDIMEMYHLALWGCTAVDTKDVLAGGVMNNWTRMVYQDRDKINARGNETYGNTLAMLRDLNLVNGSMMEGFIRRGNVDYTNTLTNASLMFVPGEVTITKNGVRVVNDRSSNDKSARAAKRVYRQVKCRHIAM